MGRNGIFADIVVSALVGIPRAAAVGVHAAFNSTIHAFSLGSGGARHAGNSAA